MQTTLTIKTDKKLRDAAKKTAQKLGIPLTTVINAHLREFVRNGHFEVSLEPRPEVGRAWLEASRMRRDHPEQVRSFDDVEEFITALGLA